MVQPAGTRRANDSGCIIRRVFAAGLSVESAAGLTANPEVRSRIEAAVSELDQVIREIRNAVFQGAQHPDSGGLSQETSWTSAGSWPPRPASPSAARSATPGCR